MKKTAIVIAVILVIAAFAGIFAYRTYKWHIVAYVLKIDQPKYSVVMDENVRIPMRDGVELAADIYRPDSPGKYPVVLLRTCYGRKNPDHKYGFAAGLFASQGYVFIVQDTRGKFGSEGEWYPYVNEARDGYDTQEWAGVQPWSSGSVGTYGISYWGSTQWLSAPDGSGHLKAMIPIMTAQNLYRRWIYNGIFRINDVLNWHYDNAHRESRHGGDVDRGEAVKHLPLIEADNAMGEDLPHYNDWIRHPEPGPYWDRINVDDEVSSIKAPALIIEGWYDYYLDCAIADYNRMKTLGGDEAKMSRLIIGPWTHNTKSKFDDIDFGSDAGFMKQVRLLVKWFDYWLKGEKNSIADSGPIHIFIMGRNQWRTEQEWPLARTRYTKYYLHSKGGANTAAGNGSLSTEAPAVEKPDTYTYDPASPVPSIGGTSIYGEDRAGPEDQAEVESRNDVLVYSTAPLKQDIEVTGPVTLVLYASSSARDTDFTATLTDVYQDGRSIDLKTGVLRARYRNSLTRHEMLKPGKVYPFTIKLGATSNLFRKGHRIRLQVSSSRFPEYGRNLNTGAPVGMTAETVTAEQTVYHDRAYPSHVILPVIPEPGG